MDEEEFERLEKIISMLNEDYTIPNEDYTIPNEDYTIPNEDLEWMIHKLRVQDTMINLMASNLTSPINGTDWVKKYYKEEAEKRICGK
jgi:hypothetical protein